MIIKARNHYSRFSAVRGADSRIIFRPARLEIAPGIRYKNLQQQLVLGNFKSDINKLTIIMKENRKLIANLPIYFLIIIFISGCNLVEKKEGFQIPESLRTEIWKTESDICTSIMKREYDKALQLFNDSLAAGFMNMNLDSVFFGLQYGLFEYPFFAQDIYYQKGLLKNTQVDVLFEDNEYNSFSLKYISHNNETAVTTALLGDGDIKYCLIMIFGKYNNIWKADYIRIGLYMVDGKDALDWIQTAEDWIERQDYIMAKYSMRMSNMLFKPAPEIWYFVDEPSILKNIQKIEKKIGRNFSFYGQVEEIDTKPHIDDFYPILIGKKIYPAIKYKTKLSLDDSISIENECTKLDTLFGNYYKNMTQDSIFVIITENYIGWEEPDKFLVKKRKLIKENQIEKKTTHIAHIAERGF